MLAQFARDTHDGKTLARNHLHKFNVAESYLKCSCSSCGGHIEFPASGAGSSVTCPHCGWPTTLTPPSPGSHPSAPVSSGESQRQVFLIALAGAAVIAFAAFAVVYWAPVLKKSLTRSKTNSFPHETDVVSPIQLKSNNHIFAVSNMSSSNQVVTAPNPWRGLVPGPIKIENTHGSRLVYAIGELRNTANRQRFGVKILLTLFDDKSRKVGAATDYTQVIEPEKSWTFKALITDHSATRAEVESVSEQ